MTQIVNEQNADNPNWKPRECIFFDPISVDCPIFNPLFGPEVSIIENMATTFRMFGEGSSQFFQDNNETLLRNALKILKRWEFGHPNGREVTLVDLSSLLNGGKTGVEILEDFSKLKPRNFDQLRENEEIYIWFKNEYLAGKSGEKGAPKTYEHTSAVRTQLTKLNSNEYLRRVLNPTPDDKDKPRLDFAKALEERQVLAISTAQGDLQDLGKFLGYFIILNFQSAVFNRPGTVDTRPPHILQIDEFQTYANMGFANMLTQGRSYRVSSVLATQNRSLIGANAGKDAKNFMDLVSTNARNVVIYPGANYEDASYYSKQFGEVTEREIERGISRPVQSIAYGLDGLGKRPSESIREVEKTKARFSPNDITYRPFGEVTIGIIKNNSIQAPVAAKLSFIEYSVKKKMDAMIEEYQQRRKEGWIKLKEEQEMSLNPQKDADIAHHKGLNSGNTNNNHSLGDNFESSSLNFDEEFMNLNQTDAVNDANRVVVGVKGTPNNHQRVANSGSVSKNVFDDEENLVKERKIAQIQSKKVVSNSELYQDEF